MADKENYQTIQLKKYRGEMFLSVTFIAQIVELMYTSHLWVNYTALDVTGANFLNLN